VTHEDSVDDRLIEWLDAGPHHVPARPLVAAISHARAHPHRRMVASGLRRSLMDTLELIKVEPRRRRWLALSTATVATAVVVLMVIGAIVESGGLDDPRSNVVAPPDQSMTPSPTTRAAPATDQEPSDRPLPEPGGQPVRAVVTALADCMQTSSGSLTQVGDMRYYRGAQTRCSYLSADPRVTGTGTSVDAVDRQADNTAQKWGTLTIEAEAGAWSGWYHAVWDADLSNYRWTSVLGGSGDYAELRLRLTGEGGRDSFQPAHLDGIIETAETIPIDDSSVLLGLRCVTRAPGTERTVGDLTEIREVVIDCSGLSSDPRLDGRRTLTLDLNQQPDGSARMKGTMTIDGPEGYWRGPLTGAIEAGRVSQAMNGLLTGSGAYAGLELQFWLIGSDDGYVIGGEIRH